MKIKLLIILLMMSTMMWSQNKVLWQKQSINTNSVKKENHLSLKKYQTFNLNTEALRQSLVGVAQRGDTSNTSNTILSFPNSEGELERFSVKEASIMHPDLQASYPEIRSFVAQGIDNPSSIMRFSLSHHGFSGMILSANGKNTFIEPLGRNSSNYIVFNRTERIDYNDDFECSVSASIRQTVDSQSNTAFRNADDSTLRTYRLAVSATGEYTQFHGGSVADALAAINTTMTRVQKQYGK